MPPNLHTFKVIFILLFCYSLSLYIISLFVSLAHREGFSGKIAAGNYKAEKIVLCNGGKPYPNAEGRKLLQLLFAVNIVNFAAVFFNKFGDIAIELPNSVRNVAIKRNFRFFAVYYNICVFVAVRL